MSTWRMLFCEIRHRRFTFFLGVLAVTGAVALFVALLTMGRASTRETKRLMRNLGFNVLIVPKQTDMAEFWAEDFLRGDMPEEYVDRLAGSKNVYADHYVGTLEKKIKWRGKDVLLTGVSKETPWKYGRKKAPMGYAIKPGHCYVGYEIARSLGIKRGSKLTVLGKELLVDRILLPAGSKDDVRIYTNLKDAQDMLGMPGRINMIQALGCLCEGGTLDSLRDAIAKILPDTHVAELQTIAAARSQTRRMVEEHVEFIVMSVLFVSAAWVGLLALLNVRERRQEIGVLRALGFGSERIAALFLGRVALMGFLGGLVGFALGTWLAMHYGPGIFKLTFSKVHPAYDLLLPSVVLAPIVSILAGLIPAALAITQDPAVTLTQEGL